MYKIFIGFGGMRDRIDTKRRSRTKLDWEGEFQVSNFNWLEITHRFSLNCYILKA